LWVPPPGLFCLHAPAAHLPRYLPPAHHAVVLLHPVCFAGCATTALTAAVATLPFSPPCLEYAFFLLLCRLFTVPLTWEACWLPAGRLHLHRTLRRCLTAGCRGIRTTASYRHACTAACRGGLRRTRRLLRANTACMLAMGTSPPPSPAGSGCRFSYTTCLTAASTSLAISPGVLGLLLYTCHLPLGLPACHFTVGLFPAICLPGGVGTFLPTYT